MAYIPRVFSVQIVRRPVGLTEFYVELTAASHTNGGDNTEITIAASPITVACVYCNAAARNAFRGKFMGQVSAQTESRFSIDYTLAVVEPVHCAVYCRTRLSRLSHLSGQFCQRSCQQQKSTGSQEESSRKCKWV